MCFDMLLTMHSMSPNSADLVGSSSICVHVLREAEVTVHIMLGITLAPKWRRQLLQPLTHRFFQVVGALQASAQTICPTQSRPMQSDREPRQCYQVNGLLELA